MIATIVSASRKAKTLLILLVGLAANLGGGLSWAAPPGSAWGTNYFPNVELTTQEGAKVRFYDDLIKGKVFAINFIYTHCTASCPLETAAMRKIYQALGERMGRDVFFYTVSIDAERDDPATLKAYAERYKTGPGWLFLSGNKADVTLIRQKLGMYRNDGKAEKDLSEHSTVILMGNEQAGQWIKRSPFEEPQALARILGSRLQTRHASASLQGAGESVDPLTETPGGKLFHSSCAACHSTGREDGIGPGLAGVTKTRDRNWLKRWIKEPDKLLEKKDRLAVELFNKYNQVYMPNLKLSDQDVEGLVQYLESLPEPKPGS